MKNENVAQNCILPFRGFAIRRGSALETHSERGIHAASTPNHDDNARILDCPAECDSAKRQIATLRYGILRHAARIISVLFLCCVFLSPASASITGTKSALVMLVSFNDAPIDCTVAEVTGFWFTNSPLNVDSFYNEATWGNVRWTGSVINVSINFSRSPCSADAWANAADAAAVAQGYNPNAYSARVYSFPSSAGSCGYAFAAGNRVWNFHGTDLFAYAHEVGHTIGLHHASTDHNNDGVIDNEYGGMDDCMGGESYTFNAPHKIMGGWLPRRDSGGGGWRTVTADGVYQISPLQINPASNPPYSQALKIIPPTGIPYFLSYRQPLGFDQGWTASQVGKDGRTGTSFDPTPSISAYPYVNGVGIHRHPGGTGVQTLEIAVLRNNQQFVVPGTGIVIRQLGRDANQVTVNISGFGGGLAANGITFYEHGNYGGAQSQPLTPGNYTLSQMSALGVANDWASSCKVPNGLRVIMYEHDNFQGGSWIVTANTPSFAALSGNANDKMSSCIVQVIQASVPSAPTDLSATGGDAHVRLSWTATPGATGYIVKRGVVSGGPYITVGNPGVSVFVDNSVTNGSTYFYVVSALNATGESAASSQVSAIPTSDLLAHWKFDETSGTVAADSSGNNNHCTLVNNPTRVFPGRVGPAALQFNSANSQWVTAPSSVTLNNPTKAITISAWVLANDWNSNRRILQKGNSDNQYRLLAESGNLRFHLSGVNTLSTTLPPTGAWIHIAATWDGSTMFLYTNGVERARLDAGGTINTTGDPLYIATKNNTAPAGDRFNGRLDDVRIYNRALSGAEIATLMTNAPPMFVANPFDAANANAGQPYSGSIAGHASDRENDPLTFLKLGGPAWLSIAANGALSGTPFSADAGTNSFLVRVTDSSGAFAQATMNVAVSPAAPIVATFALAGSELLLGWTGGIAPYQIQVTTNLVNFDWQNVSEPLDTNSIVLPLLHDAAYYRILGR